MTWQFTLHDLNDVNWSRKSFFTFYECNIFIKMKNKSIQTPSHNPKKAIKIIIFPCVQNKAKWTIIHILADFYTVQHYYLCITLKTLFTFPQQISRKENIVKAHKEEKDITENII